jgi:hypothetical protein
MPLCSICQSIDFLNLPSIPDCYEGRWASIKPGIPWVGFWNWKLKYQGERKYTRLPNLPPSLGTSFHPNIADLRKAAKNCSICTIVAKDAQELKEHLHQAGYTDEYLESNKQGPDWKMWLAKGPEHTDGFMILSLDVGTRAQAYVLSALRLSVQSDDKPYASRIQGRLLDEDDDFEKRFRAASLWLDQCDKNHACTKCTTDGTTLPSRVLDVYSQIASGLALCETHGKPGRYAALSHVWGHTNNPFVTTIANIETLKKGIDITQMPKTYRDAVTLSRKLGIRYLWIDAVWSVNLINNAVVKSRLTKTA